MPDEKRSTAAAATAELARCLRITKPLSGSAIQISRPVMITAYRSESSRKFAKQLLLTWIILAVLECHRFAIGEHDLFQP
jgi:hypothetical protein